MATNVATAAVNRGSSDILAIPQASEPCLNQAYCMGESMRTLAQSKLNASITIGNGPDMYDGNGQ